MPGIPLFVVTHRVPATVPAGDPPYTSSPTASNPPSSEPGRRPKARTCSSKEAGIVQQALRVGLMDELTISLVPVVLGRGVRLLDGLGPGSVALDLVDVADAPGVTHLTYRVVK
jgi:hypothetical protein